MYFGEEICFFALDKLINISFWLTTRKMTLYYQQWRLWLVSKTTTKKQYWHLMQFKTWWKWPDHLCYDNTPFIKDPSSNITTNYLEAIVALLKGCRQTLANMTFLHGLGSGLQWILTFILNDGSTIFFRLAVNILLRIYTSKYSRKTHLTLLKIDTVCKL